MMRLVIDDTRCSGNGRCYALFPDLFADDDRGYGRVLGDGVLRQQDSEVARNAVLCCPEYAISVEDDQNLGD
jgi:ferredoxin